MQLAQQELTPKESIRSQQRAAEAERQRARTQEIIRQEGRWVTEKQYAEIHSIPKATLANWRFRDRIAQRSEAPPGLPRYRHFGKAVRYWLAPEQA